MRVRLRGVWLRLGAAQSHFAELVVTGSLPPDFREISIEGCSGRFLVRKSFEEAFQRMVAEQNPFEAPKDRTRRGQIREIQAKSGEALIIRRYQHGGVFGWALGEWHWGWGRAIHELSVSEAARAKGLATPEIVAIRGERLWGPFWRLDLLTRKISGSQPLEAVLRSRPGLQEQRHLIHGVATFVRQMHQIGLWHADLHIRNLMVRTDESGGEPEIFIVDIDRSRMVSALSPSQIAENLFRLNRSLEKFGLGRDRVSSTDRVRFLHAYSGDGETRNSQGRKRMKGCARHLARHRLWWRLAGSSK